MEDGVVESNGAMDAGRDVENSVDVWGGMPQADTEVSEDAAFEAWDAGNDTDAVFDAEGDMADVPDMPPPYVEMCPVIPDCTGLDPGTTEHTIRRLESCAFRLRLQDRSSTAVAELDAIAAAAKGYVSLNGLNLNRTGQAGVTAETADRLKNHDFFGFRWNSGDMATTDWYPQGITGNEDAGVGGRRLMVSWYDHDEAAPAKGVRISVVDLATSPPKYRHVLLVEPDGSTFAPVLTGAGNPLHAGGIVWFGDKLYVADTGNGFRVFDLSRIIEVTHTDDTNRIGVSAGRVDAFGYRYIVGQIARYRQPSAPCAVGFSFAGLDRTTDPPRITTGEYRVDEPGGRLARWVVDPQTGWLATTEGGFSQAMDAYVGGQTRMQGALSVGDAFYISSSSQAGRLGRLYRTRVGQTSSITAWVYGAEDLYYELSRNRIWTAAEHPNARDVVSIPRQAP